MVSEDQPYLQRAVDTGEKIGTGAGIRSVSVKRERSLRKRETSVSSKTIYQRPFIPSGPSRMREHNSFVDNLLADKRADLSISYQTLTQKQPPEYFSTIKNAIDRNDHYGAQYHQESQPPRSPRRSGAASSIQIAREHIDRPRSKSRTRSSRARDQRAPAQQENAASYYYDDASTQDTRKISTIRRKLYDNELKAKQRMKSGQRKREPFQPLRGSAVQL